MSYENFLQYAPIIVVVSGFLVQQRLIVTPEQLERKHREILSEMELRYAKSDRVSELREQIFDINDKITKLYELVLSAHQKRKENNG